MKLFIAILFLFSSAQAQQSCLEVDIVLVADMSGSVQGHEYQVAEACMAFVDRFGLSEASVKIGLIMFNNDAYLLTDLTTNKDKLKNLVVAMGNTEARGGTNMDAALQEAFNQIVHGRRVMKIIVLISDGAPDTPLDVETTVAQINATGVVSVCGIYVGTDSGNAAFMEKISNPHCYVQSQDFTRLAEELKKLDICL